ncbi:ubiquitin carboxyl-terminal hydrolase 43, partial [Python bivittatus]|uniref:ubiquitinyl hydrolase 1 n=1 Tax=Python bivittatus TaxID=176946 RepID=A0A9F2WEN9_PYTBI
MGELEAEDKLGPGTQTPLGRARSSAQHHSGTGRRRRAVRAFSKLARRLLQTLRGARRRREGAEAEDDEGGFKRPPGPDRGQAGGGGGGSSVRLWLGALSPPPAASSGDPRPLTPGAQGLKNHGNTCFLNAVVQCLSHTELLAAFLLLALPDQPRPSRPGSKAASGEVTQHLAALVRALWTLEYTPQLSADFKNVVSKYGAQFRGNAQHDALEFLLWLLDRMHEDLCSVSFNQKLKMSGKLIDVLATQCLAKRSQVPQNYCRAFISVLQEINVALLLECKWQPVLHCGDRDDDVVDDDDDDN